MDNIKILEPAFIELIQKKYGLVFHVDQAESLSSTILNACKEFHCQPQEYFELLKHCPTTSPLLTYLVSGITVGETYFFREQNQFHLLEKTLLPRLINQKLKEGNLTLRVWSAGCSTGEELYSVAILIYELIENLNQWNLQLLGTDINRIALEKAMSGIYSKRSMRSISERNQQRYFTKKGNFYELSEAIRKLVRFNYLNLMDESYPSILNGTHDLDLILCRNVLIYFDNETISKIINKLTTCLLSSGYFLFGASDPIPPTESLVFNHEEEAIYFSLKKPNNEVLP